MPQVQVEGKKITCRLLDKIIDVDGNHFFFPPILVAKIKTLSPFWAHLKPPLCFIGLSSATI